jgi:predicted aspartyl protease
MRSSLFAAAAAACSSAFASAAVVSVPFSRSNGFDRLGELAKRDGTLSLSAVNNITGGGYYAEFEIGTPGQKLTFLIDTGSSDTWANSVTASLCSDEKEEEQVGFCLAQCECLMSRDE